MSNITRRDALKLAGLFVTGTLAGCGANGDSPTDAGSAAADGQTIIFAYKNVAVPFTYDDENGNATGHDIDMIRAINEEMPEYTFEFVGTSYDDAYMGLEAGNYDAALTNAFWTEERAEKYQIPEEPLGANVLLLVVRAENADIRNFDDLAASGLKLSPIKAGNGMYYIVKAYNDEHPDAPVELVPSDDSVDLVAGNVEELCAGRYDAVIYTKSEYEDRVVREDGESHQFYDQVSASEFTLAYSYPMFSKDLDPAFVQAFSDATAAVKASGRASEISMQYMGYDIWNYDFEA